MSSWLQTLSRGALAATGVLALSAEAHAQDNAAQGGSIDEVVVTATRRPEEINKVAASITAVSQAALDNVGANDIIDAVTTVPNLHSTVANDLSIRGVGSNLFTPSPGGTPVALHIDGVYTNDRGILTRSTYDLERIEVLRGPQGTLYGRNATGGVVNIITQGATDSFTAYANATFESGDDVILRGAVNLPLAPNLAVRIAGFAEEGDGFQRNSSPAQHDGDAPDYQSARLSAKWEPISSLTWTGSLTQERDHSLSGAGQYAFFLDQNNQPFPTHLPSNQTPPLAPSTGPLALGDNVTDNFADRNRADLDVFSAKSNLHWAFSDALSLTYLAGYRRATDDGTTNAIPFVLRTSATKTVETSHELTANYESTRWHGVAGLYHFSNVTHDNNLIHIWIPDGENEPELTPAIDQMNQVARGVDTTDAIFGQATLSLTQAMRLTLGARYTQDKIASGADTQSSCPFGLAASPFDNGFNVFLPDGVTSCASLDIPNFSQVVVIPAVTAKFSHPSYLGTVEYDLSPQVMTYASVSTGYRTGGVSVTDPVVFYRPESNIAYEAGIRARLFDNRVSLNLSAFRENYRDMQVQILAIPNPITINAAEATIDGVEGEFIWAASRHDRFAGYATWLNARFDKFPGAFSNFRNTTTDATGNDLAQSPEWSARVSYAHIFDLGSAGQLTSTVQSYWQDVSFAWYTNNPEDKIPSFFRSDLIVHYAAQDNHVSLEAFVNNIENYRTIGSIFPAIGLGRMQWDLYSRGRIAGVRLGLHF